MRSNGPTSTPLDVRRVSVTAADPDSGEVMVRDGNGWQATVRASTRPKGTGFPAPGEIWIISRSGPSWMLGAQVGALPPPLVTGSRATADPVTLSLLAALTAIGVVRDGTTP